VIRALALLLLASLPGWLLAHPLAPALLSLTEAAPGQYEVHWQLASTRLRGVDLQPQWPADCRAETLGPLTPVSAQAMAQRWRLHCPGALSGRVLGVNGLDRAGLTVVLRIEAGAQRWQGLLDAGSPRLTVPPLAQGSVFGRYLWLGVEHLLLGADHLLFVLGLFGLVRGLRARLITLTAFTLGHSLTLALAVLDRIAVPPALAEFGIALSLVFLALALLRTAAAGSRPMPLARTVGEGGTLGDSRGWGEGARQARAAGAASTVIWTASTRSAKRETSPSDEPDTPRAARAPSPPSPPPEGEGSKVLGAEPASAGMARHPVPWALGFGLLHGLGFAGALQGIGLPADEIPLALLAFNLGIEFGQVAVVLLLAGVTALWPRPQQPGVARRAAWVAGYAVGSLGVYAALDRSLGIWLGA
jgi:hypothetical protein